MSDTTLTMKELAVFTDALPHIRALKEQGYAVIIWTPEELAGVSARQVENRSVELGHQVIEDLK